MQPIEFFAIIGHISDKAIVARIASIKESETSADLYSLLNNPITVINIRFGIVTRCKRNAATEKHRHH